MKYVLTAVLFFILSFFSFSAGAQSTNGKPFFAQSFAMIDFDYENAYIRIDNKEASYSDLLHLQDSDMLKVELYPKKRAVKEFGKDVGRHGVILFTTKKYKIPPFVETTEDSVSYYRERGIRPYIKLDRQATFNGDTTHKAWIQFLQKHLHTDTPTEQGAPMGLYKVMIHFTVNEDGALSDIGVYEDAGFGTGNEAVRMMKTSPAWQPGIYKGKPAKDDIKQPLTFQVVEM